MRLLHIGSNVQYANRSHIHNYVPQLIDYEQIIKGTVLKFMVLIKLSYSYANNTQGFYSAGLNLTIAQAITFVLLFWCVS